MKIALLAACVFALAAPLVAATVQDPALRDELLKMAEEDQKVRPQPGESLTPPQIEAMLQADARHARRMREIVSQVGWPGKTRVGEEAASRAWLLVQHFDLADQDFFLPLIQQAVTQGEASGKDLAYLEDRVRIRHGRKQGYGTQYRVDPNDPGIWIREPIEDPAHVDERRKAVGLLPLLEFEQQIPHVKIRPSE